MFSSFLVCWGLIVQAGFGSMTHWGGKIRWLGGRGFCVLEIDEDVHSMVEFIIYGIYDYMLVFYIITKFS